MENVQRITLDIMNNRTYEQAYSKQYDKLRDILLEVFTYIEDKYGEIFNAYKELLNYKNNPLYKYYLLITIWFYQIKHR